MGISCFRTEKRKNKNSSMNPKNASNFKENNNINKNIKGISTFNTNSSTKKEKESIEKKENLDFDCLFNDYKNDIKNLNNIIQKDEYDTFKEYYYLINNNWIEECKKNNKILEIQIQYKISNDITYPYNFLLINEKIFNIYKVIEMINKNNRLLISLIKGYIIIEDKDNKTNNILFFLCPLNENIYIFNIEFIFSFSSEKDKYICYNKIKEIIKNRRFKNKIKNKCITLFHEQSNKIGFYICYPSHSPNNHNHNRRIFTYYEINKIYKEFLDSINNLIFNKIKIIYPIFIVKGYSFEKLLKEIHFDDYNNCKEESLSQPINESINNLLIDIDLSYEECIHESHICLINYNFCNALNINLDYNDKNLFLLFNNNNYYIYFKNNKKILKIEEDKNYKINNYWKSEVVDDNDININNLEKFINQIKIKNNNKKTILKILIYIYCNDVYIKNKIKSQEINLNIEKIKLINKYLLN